MLKCSCGYSDKFDLFCAGELCPMCSGDRHSIDKLLKMIKSDCSIEIYDGELDFRHVGLDDICFWYQNVEKADDVSSWDLGAFDLVSSMSNFEHWVKQKSIIFGER